MGLKSNGTLVAVGSKEYGLCNVTDFDDVISVSMGLDHMIVQKKDGSLMSTGRNIAGECEISSWTGLKK